VFQNYLDQNPHGLFVEAARAKILALNVTAPVAAPKQAAPRETPPKDAPAQVAKAAPAPKAAPITPPPMTKLNAQVQQAVNAARQAQQQARSDAAQAHEAQNRAEAAMQQAEQAAQAAASNAVGYGMLTGPITGGGTFRWQGQVIGRMPGSLGVFSVTSGVDSGNRYEGQVQNNLGNGYGVNFRASGLRFEGEQKDSHYGDFGVILFPDGERFEGRFQAAKPLSGVYFGNANRIYSEKAGQWVDGKLTGYGVIAKKDGGSVAGAFKDDDLNGYGAKFDASGHILQQGIFSAGVLTTPMTGN